jgi:hypothetical protein
MAKNRLINSEKKEKKQTSSGSTSRFISSILDGTILTKEKVESLLPFLLYSTVLAIFLIFNTYYAEKKAREVESIRNEIIELRLRYITTKSELMVLSNQSEVARNLKNRGIVESVVPPRQLPSPEKEKRFLSGILSRNN